MTASNTQECFTEFIGQKYIGVLFGQLRPNTGLEEYTLVFEDGRGLCFSDRGTYWIASAQHVAAAVKREEARLRDNQREIERVLAMAGSLPPVSSKPKEKKGKKGDQKET